MANNSLATKAAMQPHLFHSTPKPDVLGTRMPGIYGGLRRSYGSIAVKSTTRRRKQRMPKVLNHGDTITRSIELPNPNENAGTDLFRKKDLDYLRKNWRKMTSLNYWIIRDYHVLVSAVNVLEPDMQRLTNKQLQAKTKEFRCRLRDGETLDDIQAEAFAVVREAARRTLGMRHFDVQIIGGAVLHDGAIAEMKTGEGKTLVSTLAAYLNSLTGRGVHVVTVNDYLAQRDAEWMGRIHRFLGISVGLIQSSMGPEERKANYTCDITYSSNSEIGFDYLRDNLGQSKEHLVMRWPKPFNFAIVDEVDSVLIDDGRNPLLISGEAPSDAARFPVAAQVANLLVRDYHYNVELKENAVELTEEGIATAELALDTDDLWDERDPWARFVINALKAKEFYRRDVNYIVKDGQVQIINENAVLNGCSVEHSEYLSELLREWEIPHNVLNARPKYAAREAQIVAQAGRKGAITISTNMAGRGTDIILGGNHEMLAEEIIEDSLMCFMTKEAPNIDMDGAPLSQLGLAKVKLSPSSLGSLAKTVVTVKHVCQRDGEIWSYREAKSKISASLELSRSKDVNELESLAGGESSTFRLGPMIALAYLAVLKDCKVHCTKEGLEVKRLGGLHVIGTSLHESRRIDNQLRGRAGRQGDPGSTRFMISLQDDMFVKFNFNTEWAVNLISKVTSNENIPIEGDTIKNQLLGLQKSAEQYYFGLRKNLVEFDEVLEVQRKHVYDLRQSLLLDDTGICRQRIYQYMQAVMDEIVLRNVNSHKAPRYWNLRNLLDDFHAITERAFVDTFAGVSEETFAVSLEHFCRMHIQELDTFQIQNLPVPPDMFKGIHAKAFSFKRWLLLTSDGSVMSGKYQDNVNLLRKYFGDFLIASYIEAVRDSGYDNTYAQEVERAIALKALDSFWRDHLLNMNRLNTAVSVRGFGSRNPLEEYKIDGCRFFITMLGAARHQTVTSLLRYWLSPNGSLELAFAN
ncbi:protein translocase subunit SECA2, chloroplastic isoform X3 [Cryptomeria japonica]|uniref:protein translocase subunit SECA2, chloroplastic isoform X3 n=1 Tax=Cryptomeria japonica TaxID=3369 RepID=UPI0025ACF311|nr:protein translocase subunit SECA2, chloroplastic isoform X3 [Cryptomeria japonica]